LRYFSGMAFSVFITIDGFGGKAKIEALAGAA